MANLPANLPANLNVERHDGSALLTIDRPEALNSLSPDLLEDLPEAIRAASADRSCRAIVISGAGERAFCAGIDVKSVAQRDAAAQDTAQRDAAAQDTAQRDAAAQDTAQRDAAADDAVSNGSARLDPIIGGFENLHLVLSGIVRAIHSAPIPVISAVNGHAIGAGFAIAAASDLRIGSVNATFADGFVKRGISGCEMGLSYFLPKIVGPALAFDLMLTGRRIDAEGAKAMGLIGEVTAADGLVDRAMELAGSLAQNAPMAVSMTKEVMWANLHASSLDHALALESRTQVMTRNTADAAEARSAFLEKRPPDFAEPTSDRPLR